MNKVKILFIIEIILSALALIGFGYLAYLLFQYLGENTDRSIEDRIGFSAAVVIIGLLRVAISILLLCLYKKRGFVKIFRFMSLIFLCILSAAGAFYCSYEHDKEIGYKPTKNYKKGKLLIIIGMIFAIARVGLATWYGLWFFSEAQKFFGLAIILFMLLVLVLAFLPVSYAVIGLYSHIMLLIAKPHTKLFRITQIISIVTLSIFAYIGTRIIDSEQINNDSSDILTSNSL